MRLCVCNTLHVVVRGQLVGLGSLLLPHVPQELKGPELRLSGLAADAFTSWAISLAFTFSAVTCAHTESNSLRKPGNPAI